MKFQYIIVIIAVYLSCVKCTPCRSNDTLFDGNCYKPINHLYLYAEAVNYCRNQNSKIITIHSQAQNDYVVQMGLNAFINSYMWIGLTYVNGKYQWQDGTQLDYTDWKTTGFGLPNDGSNDVIASLPRYEFDGKGWSNNHNFTDAANFICMYPINTLSFPVTPTPMVPTVAPGTRPPTPATPVTCKPNYRQFDGNCYFFAPTNYEVFTDAVRWCQQDNASLVSIHYKEEDDWVAQTALDVSYAPSWIGLHQVNGVWQWVDGTPVDYTNFGTGEREGLDDRVGLHYFHDGNSQRHYWGNDLIGAELRFICKYTPGREVRIPTTSRPTTRKTTIRSTVTTKSTSMKPTIRASPGTTSRKPAQNRCDPTDLNIGKRCFSFNSQKLNYADAESSCNSNGKTLAILDNIAQINFVTSTAGSKFGTIGNFWIGLHRNGNSGQFIWPGDVPVTFSYWSPGYPLQGQTTVTQLLSNGKWMTEDFNILYPSVCSGLL